MAADETTIRISAVGKEAFDRFKEERGISQSEAFEEVMKIIAQQEFTAAHPGQAEIFKAVDGLTAKLRKALEGSVVASEEAVAKAREDAAKSIDAYKQQNDSLKAQLAEAKALEGELKTVSADRDREAKRADDAEARVAELEAFRDEAVAMKEAAEADKVARTEAEKAKLEAEKRAEQSSLALEKERRAAADAAAKAEKEIAAIKAKAEKDAAVAAEKLKSVEIERDRNGNDLKRSEGRVDLLESQLKEAQEAVSRLSAECAAEKARAEAQESTIEFLKSQTAGAKKN